MSKRATVIAALAGCAAKAPPDECSGAQRSDLSWEEPASTGVSASDMLGFGLGDWSGPLWWDDGTNDLFEVVIEPDMAWEESTGDPSTCLGWLIGRVRWSLRTDDDRIDINGTTDWPVELGGQILSLGSLSIEGSSAYADYLLVPSDPAASLSSSFTIHGDGPVFLGVVEYWQPTSTSSRRCVRATNLDGELGCKDEQYSDD